MIKIYGGSGTRSIKVVWMAEEMGLDYELVPIDVMAGARPAEFLALSPTGMVPALEARPAQQRARARSVMPAPATSTSA